jgi:hypothetical protein
VLCFTYTPGVVSNLQVRDLAYIIGLLRVNLSYYPCVESNYIAGLSVSMMERIQLI